jgi:hypothetical protein
MSELKREEVTGSWRRLYHEEFHNLYSSPNIIKLIKSRRTRWVEHLPSIGETRNVYKILVGKPERKSSLGRLRWEANIRMDLREIEWKDVVWIHLTRNMDGGRLL